MTNYKLFVYGTLKSGEPNNHLLKSKENGFAELVSQGTTSKKFPLVVATRYNIPFLIDRPGEGNHIKGEVYSIDEKMLARLDMLEDYPSFYDRELQEIYVGDNDEKVTCLVYLLKTCFDKLLSFPFISEYKNTAENPYQAICQSVSEILVKDELV